MAYDLMLVLYFYLALTDPDSPIGGNPDLPSPTFPGFPSPPSSSPSLHLEVGPLNRARGSGRAL